MRHVQVDGPLSFKLRSLELGGAVSGLLSSPAYSTRRRRNQEVGLCLFTIRPPGCPESTKSSELLFISCDTIVLVGNVSGFWLTC